MSTVATSTSHRFKRAQTTGTYLAAVTVGTDEDRALIRQTVGNVHVQVRSTVRSPLRDNAFDYSPLDDAAAEAVYRDAERPATTLPW